MGINITDVWFSFARICPTTSHRNITQFPVPQPSQNDDDNQKGEEAASRFEKARFQHNVVIIKDEEADEHWGNRELEEAERKIVNGEYGLADRGYGD